MGVTSPLWTKQTFEDIFNPAELDTVGDGWRSAWRSSQRLRRLCCFRLIDRCCKTLDREAAVLDIGCAQSQFLLLLRHNYPCWKYFGNDISENVTTWNKISYPFITYKQCALPDTGYSSDSFDLIIALEVVYYLDDNDQREALLAIAATLKSGGCLLISGPLAEKGRGFDENELLQMLGSLFDIVEVKYRYARLYTSLETRLLKWLNAVYRLRTLSLASDADYDRWVRDHPRLRRAGRLLKRSRLLRSANVVFLSPFAAIMKLLLRWTGPYYFLFFLSWLVLGKAGRTGIAVVARKLPVDAYDAR